MFAVTWFFGTNCLVHIIRACMESWVFLCLNKVDLYISSAIGFNLPVLSSRI